MGKKNRHLKTYSNSVKSNYNFLQADSVPEEIKKTNTSYLEKNKEGVKLKPSKLHLSTIFFQTTSCQAHMGCTRDAGMFPGIHETGNKSST